MKAILAALIKPLLGLLERLAFYAKGRIDQRTADRMKASDDRVHTLKEMRDETAKAMAKDDADLVQSLTRKP